jgi:glycosyltransferase involved in cell wall biosynthesis
MAVLERRPDVVFVPTASWVDFGGTPVVVMVRNMEPLEVPIDGNPPREVLRNLARRAMARRACRKAARVIAVSTHVRTYLTSRWTVAADKIDVIYHGVDALHETPAPLAPPGLDRAGFRFVFAAGSIRPARGLADLIEALSTLTIGGSGLSAVIAGPTDAGTSGHRRWLERLAARSGVSDRIHWTGSLTEPQMRWCYESCDAFVMTSRAEACPNVALEAMSFGCACVSVDRPPMPEFFGPAAAYYRAGEPAELVRVLTSLLARSTDLADMKAAASARARRFEWRLTAERTVATLRAAIRS